MVEKTSEDKGEIQNTYTRNGKNKKYTLIYKWPIGHYADDTT